jgi:hypothetical protein
MLRYRNPSLPGGFLFLAFLSVGLAGCSRVQSESEAVKKSLEVNGGTQANVVKFSGTVTIDNETPAIDRLNPLYVFAYDPKNPPKGRQSPFNARCDKHGHFEFNTYGTGDGLPAGSYVVLFAQPKSNGEDGLKNLYNDPDKNAKEERFQINLSPPGRADWAFDLSVAGKDANTKPGEHTVLAGHLKQKRG